MDVAEYEGAVRALSSAVIAAFDAAVAQAFALPVLDEENRYDIIVEVADTAGSELKTVYHTSAIGMTMILGIALMRAEMAYADHDKNGDYSEYRLKSAYQFSADTTYFADINIIIKNIGPLRKEN